jgi:RNA polymerase sigma-70 factor (ECF subfamily)
VGPGPGFIGAYRTLPQLRAAAAFSGWLQRIVFRSCLLLRRGRRIETVPLEDVAELASPVPGPAALVEARATRDEILEAVRRLPEAEREAIALFYISGHSEREVGTFLGIPATPSRTASAPGGRSSKNRRPR